MPEALVLHAAGVLAAPADPAALASFCDHAGEADAPRADDLAAWGRWLLAGPGSTEAPPEAAARLLADVRFAAAYVAVGRRSSDLAARLVDRRSGVGRALAAVTRRDPTVWLGPIWVRDAENSAFPEYPRLVLAVRSGAWYRIGPARLARHGNRAPADWTDPAAVARVLAAVGWDSLLAGVTGVVTQVRHLTARETPDVVRQPA